MRENPPKLLLSYEYTKPARYCNVRLSSLRWAPFKNNLLLAFSSKLLTVISREETSLAPKHFQHICFETIEEAEFLPFSTQRTLPVDSLDICILSKKDHSIHIINWEGRKGELEVLSPLMAFTLDKTFRYTRHRNANDFTGLCLVVHMWTISR
jgi:hypothetical protein